VREGGRHIRREEKKVQSKQAVRRVNYQHKEEKRRKRCRRHRRKRKTGFRKRDKGTENQKRGGYTGEKNILRKGANRE